MERDDIFAVSEAAEREEAGRESRVAFSQEITRENSYIIQLNDTIQKIDRQLEKQNKKLKKGKKENKELRESLEKMRQKTKKKAKKRKKGKNNKKNQSSVIDLNGLIKEAISGGFRLAVANVENSHKRDK